MKTFVQYLSEDIANREVVEKLLPPSKGTSWVFSERRNHSWTLQINPWYHIRVSGVGIIQPLTGMPPTIQVSLGTDTSRLSYLGGYEWDQNIKGDHPRLKEAIAAVGRMFYKIGSTATKCPNDDTHGWLNFIVSQKPNTKGNVFRLCHIRNCYFDPKSRGVVPANAVDYALTHFGK